MPETAKKIEFGDFQTPLELSAEMVNVVLKYDLSIHTVIEPSCGLGSFIKALIKARFSKIQNIIGWEINSLYVRQLLSSINMIENGLNINIFEQDFFQIDWGMVERKYDESILFIGNPPWVTNSALGKLSGKNLPQKSNFNGHTGLEAITGKSNFDISEWMLMRIAEFISGKKSAMAFLVKTSVARKVFSFICRNNLSIGNFLIKEIDAKKYFNVNVDACMFYAEGIIENENNKICPVFSSLSSEKPYKIMGLSKAKLVSDIKAYKALKDIDSQSEFNWRSGVKHDCSSVMEFVLKNNVLVNGLNEGVSLPDDFIYPMYKSSNISKETLSPPVKYMLITQKKIGNDTKFIKKISPLTWDYLEAHAEKLDRRKSSIYKKSPRFSVFGVGDYTFKPWKVAISGLYKNIRFSLIGPHKDKPVVFDDTCYMLGFDKEVEASFVYRILISDIAKRFIDSLVFKDSKRPITASLLNRINIESISKNIGLHTEYKNLFTNHTPK
jgi:hypothetical protein